MIAYSHDKYMSTRGDEDPKFPIIPVIGMIIIMLLALLSTLNGRAQCPQADVCENALQFNLTDMTPGEVVYYPETLCNGTYNGIATIPYCDDENGGDPWGCSSSTSTEYDFWIAVTVDQAWVYTFWFNSNYFLYAFDQLDGGAQMWIYDDCFSLTMLETALCDQEQEQSIMMDVYLEPGTYYVQVDGYGASVGCGEFSVYMQGFLGLSIAEIVQNPFDCRDLTIYNLLGQRVR